MQCYLDGMFHSLRWLKCVVLLAMTVPWLTSDVAAAARGAAGMGAAARRTTAKKTIATGCHVRNAVVQGAAWGGAAERGVACLRRQNQQSSQRASANSTKSKKLHSRQLAAATQRKTRCARSVSIADVDLLVGDVAESDARHKTRHAGFMPNCPRCLAMRRWGEIERLAPWVAPRPVHLGGAWRMGCRICAAGRWDEQVLRRRGVHKEANKSLGFCKQSISRCSVWGEVPVS